MQTQVDDLVENLAHVRTKLLERRDVLCAEDPRIEDIIWPCEEHDQIGATEFESVNTCLVADVAASKLWLSRPTLEDIIRLVPNDQQLLAATWFFVHQLVHVAQGLAYVDFRTLNRGTNRHETMRPDCQADFISLKTLALMMDLDDPETGVDAHGYVKWFARLLDTIVPSMMAMEPNIFIPRKREIEVKRMFALLLMRYYLTQAVSGDQPVLNGSIFPWWTEDRTQLYVFVDQVQTLGRGGIDVEPAALDALLDALHNGRIEDAYGLISGLGWPVLSPTTLPSRLLHRLAS
jgi:hypothetical protein